MIEILSIGIYPLFFVAIYINVFLLIIFLEKRTKIKEEEKKEKVLDYPSVTVIVPCYNEEQTVLKTVFSLLSLDYPKDKLKIFIIDDGSIDKTFEIIQEFHGHKQIEIFHKENGGKYTALNLGLKKAKSDLIGCLDADSFVEPLALKHIVKYFNNSDVSAVFPRIKVYNPKGFLGLIQKTEYELSCFTRKIFSMLDAISVVPGAFSFFRREVFKKIGNYRHAHNGEDMEITLRLQSHSLKIENCHSACVYTTVPASFKALYKQRVRWISGFLANVNDYRHLFFNRKNSNLGFFLLPMAIILIFFSVCVFPFALWNVINFLLKKVEKTNAIGFEFTFSWLKPDWFFINTGTTMFLTIFSLILIIILISLSKHLAKEKIRPSFSLLCFVLFYSFISFFWHIRSVINFAFAKKTTWR